MQATQDLSILSLILNASILVQLVMLLLVGLSVASWTIIFRKGLALMQFVKTRSVSKETFGRVVI